MSPVFKSFFLTLAALLALSLTLEGQAFTPIHINAGGGQYTDLQGVVWSADNYYIGATGTTSTAAAITGTLVRGLSNQPERKQLPISNPVPAGRDLYGELEICGDILDQSRAACV